MTAIGFHSTRSGGGASAPDVTLGTAIARGLAPDGGLYVPRRLPALDLAGLGELSRLPDIAALALGGFFEGDALAPDVAAITSAALDLPVPTTAVEGTDDALFALELYHGPTAAFKDFGARFLAETLERLEARAASPLTILVATSGDTGGAVAAAFHGRPWVRVVILYPKGLVSPRQEQQLTCWGDNIVSLRVDGTFDDCQRMVKEAFVDAELARRHRFSSANSINIGRLLPQMTYYVASSLDVQRRTGARASFIIPAGNLGNAFAALWARALGLPIDRIVLAHNANRCVPDYVQTGRWEPRRSIPTLASAMDVGNPSNMERLRELVPTIDAMRAALAAESVDDAAIAARIRADFARFGRIWCPHTATAAEVYARLAPAARRAGPWVLVATAHPAKFNEIVEPLIGASIAVPESLARLLALPRRHVDVAPSLPALAAALE